MALSRYHLGCPVWSNRDWVGDFFTADAKPAEFLRQYSAVFDTVEGNNCFYGLPWLEKLALWIGEGREPYFFAHTPNNRQAPHLARRVHQWLRARCPEVGDLPPWPAEPSIPPAPCN